MQLIFISFLLLQTTFNCSPNEVEDIEKWIRKEVYTIDTVRYYPKDLDSYWKRISRLDRTIIQYLECPASNPQKITVTARGPYNTSYDVLKIIYSSDSTISAITYFEYNWGNGGDIPHTFLRWRINSKKIAVIDFKSLGGQNLYIGSPGSIHRLTDTLFLIIGHGHEEACAIPITIEDDRILISPDLFSYHLRNSFDVIKYGESAYLNRTGMFWRYGNFDNVFNPETLSFNFGRCNYLINDQEFSADVTIKFHQSKFIVIEKNKVTFGK